jgi:hypothetical protein
MKGEKVMAGKHTTKRKPLLLLSLFGLLLLRNDAAAEFCLLLKEPPRSTCPVA